MNYESIMESLNPGQRKSVETIYGPILTVAGPGTGKTHTLSARIMSLLQSEAQVDPGMILCLTFTVSGAVAMRNRLIKFIGTDAYKVHIHTFHSFCNDIIQGYLDYFGVRNIEPVSDLEVLEILYEIIDGLPTGHPLTRIKGDSYYEAYRMRNLFDIMKSEAWTPQQMHDASRRYIDDLPRREEYIYKRGNSKKGIKPGDVKKDAIASEKEKITLLLAAVDLYDTYNEMLSRRERYDFNDMIYWVIRAMKDNQYFLLSQQEKYQFVLVDEFQDTNGSQMELLRLLIGFWDHPNIYCVGDPNQSIYSFQGARIRNILDFIQDYKADVIVLNENYRSTQNILDASAVLISNNHGGLDRHIPTLANPLVSLNRGIDQHITPEVIALPTIADEERFIVTSIIRHMEQGGDPEDVAVIYRKHRQAENIIRELQIRGIPVNVVRRVNVLHEPIIRQILSIMEYVATEIESPGDSGRILFRILHYSFWDIPYEEIEGMPRAQAAVDYILLSEPIKAATLILREIVKNYYNVPVIRSVEAIINSTGMLKHIMLREDKVQQMVNIQTFFTWVKSEVFKNPLITIQGLLLKVQTMEDRGINLPVLDLNFSEKGINFMTCHGAKGLEFAAVYVMGVNRSQWEKSRSNSQQYRYPDTLTYSRDEDPLEDNRRLFYVAMTRAKQNLYITYAERDNDGKDLERSQFIDETGLSVQQVTPAGLVDQLYYQLNPTTFVPALEKTFITSLLEDYSLSVSHMIKYLGCPIAFYYENILRVPFVASEALVYGNAIHIGLKALYDMVKSGTVNIDKVLAGVRDYMAHNQGQISTISFERRLASALSIMSKYYQEVYPMSNKITLNEFSTRVVIDDVPVKYIFDKIEFNGNDVDIVDYKTGKESTTMEGVREGKGDKLMGHYRLQMVVGKLVIDNIHWKPWRFHGAGILHIDEGFRHYPIEITREEELVARKLIREVYDKIKNQEFSPGCGEESCEWCQFHKTLII